jgi:hypothetical protein
MMKGFIYCDLTPSITRALSCIAASVDNSIGYEAAGFFFDYDVVNHWEYKFLVGTDMPKWELTPRQLNCRCKINTNILHAFTDMELQLATGVDVDTVTVPRNGWHWNSRLAPRHAAAR